jgi:hypothetical protein
MSGYARTFRLRHSGAAMIMASSGRIKAVSGHDHEPAHAGGTSADPATVEPPKHPLYALTTYELKDRRRELERAIKGIAADAPVQADLRRALDAVTAEQEDRKRVAMSREPDVGHMAAADLERARRELAASLALARPGALSAGSTAVQLSAIEAELAAREGSARRIASQHATGIRLCSCGFGSDSDIRFGAHLSNNRRHRELDHPKPPVVPGRTGTARATGTGNP